MNMSPASLAMLGLIVTMWLASMGAVWKVATLLSSITGELRDLRADSERHTIALASLASLTSRPIRPYQGTGSST